MGRYSVKRYKTKRRTRDLDLILNDLSSPDSIQKLKQQAEDENLPGLGQYYCIHCAKYFLDNNALKGHLRGKIHKRRVKELAVNPYTSLESEAATGTNLEKFMARVAKYQNDEPGRKQMEIQMLQAQTQEYDLRDRQKFEEMYPEKVQEELLKAQEEEQLKSKIELKKLQREKEILGSDIEDEETKQQLQQGGVETIVTDEIIME